MLLDARLADPSFLNLVGLAVQRKQQRAQQTGSSGMPQTDDQLWQYVWDTWGVAIPRQQVCAGHVAPFTLFADAYFNRYSMLVLKGSRGFAGKSFLLSVLAATFAAQQRASVVILGGSGQQSRTVHDYMARLWRMPTAPRHLLTGEPLLTETRFREGNRVIALPASQTSVRGLHPEKLLFDEADEADLSIFDAAMGQTLSREGIPACTVVSSTHHHPDGTFTEVLRRAKEREWPIYEVCYHESLQPHGWLSAADVARKREEMTAQQWQVEVELQEPSGEHRAIDPDAVAACFQRDLGEYAGREREYIEAELPVAGATYAHGADWAKEQDQTEIVSLRTDVFPYRLVAYERMRRLPWPVMIARFDARLDRFGGQKEHAWHDKTGIGNVVEDYVEHDVTGLVFAGRSRADLFTECVAAIERGDIVSPVIDSLKAELQYCAVDDLSGAGHPPDGFVALALAYRAARQRPKSAGVIRL